MRVVFGTEDRGYRSGRSRTFRDFTLARARVEPIAILYEKNDRRSSPRFFCIVAAISIRKISPPRRGFVDAPGSIAVAANFALTLRVSVLTDPV